MAQSTVPLCIRAYKRGDEQRVGRGRRRRGDPRSLRKIERCGTERRVVEQLRNQTAFADEELRRCDVHRPGGAQRGDRVYPAGGKVAERQGERPHHAQALGHGDEGRCVLGDKVRLRRFE